MQKISRQIDRCEMIINHLQKRYLDHGENSDLDNALMIEHKHTCKVNGKRFIYPTTVCVSKGAQLQQRYCDYNTHAFYRFEEKGHIEKYKCHFRLAGLTAWDIYTALTYHHKHEIRHDDNFWLIKP